MKLSVDVLMMVIRDVETVKAFVNAELKKQPKPDQTVATAMTRLEDFSRSIGKTEITVKA